MVSAEKPAEYQVVLTPQFLGDLASAVEYIEVSLKSPLAARKMYEAIRSKVEGLSVVPQVAIRYISPSGKERFKVSYNRYDIHYAIEGDIVRVLGLKHQFQNKQNF